ncbi:MAG: NUDIX hydrolase [Sphaerochaetaceae bacterium]|nr:NUDIX hydrolase [Sphaerochaetaceae bacterium]
MENSNKDFFKTMDLAEKQLDSSLVYEGRLLKVYKDNIVLPNGHKTTREYIKHIGAVAIVAMDDKGRVAVEHQFRYPFGCELLEIPAGKLDYVGEDPLSAAQRELREETGIVAGCYEYLGPFYPTVAYSTEVIHLYLATELSFGERELDDDENINVEMVDLKLLVKQILEGKVPDAKTQAALLNVWARNCSK